ncbi:MAG: Crp/Fnr family transcriptional regulator [Desulfobacterales bacterium]|nr:MAG: Crp/Fnr family transcriptional regulator [Desulfobacterales bacterium]
MILKEIELFEGVDFEVMNEIAAICSEESYSKDTVLFEKDEQAKCLYILLGGTVYLVIKNGGSITYNLSEPGDVFGWSSMLENGKYTASGICATDLKVVKIEKDKLNRIFKNRPEAGFKVLQRLAGVISRRLSNAYRDLLSARSTDTTPSYG